MTQPVTLTDTTELYARVQQFYAGQMHLLDSGDTDKWAATFKEFPPVQRPNTFTVDDALRALADASTGSH